MFLAGAGQLCTGSVFHDSGDRDSWTAGILSPRSATGILCFPAEPNGEKCIQDSMGV